MNTFSFFYKKLPVYNPEMTKGHKKEASKSFNEKSVLTPQTMEKSIIERLTPQKNDIQEVF